jgi:hypothetical protein
MNHLNYTDKDNNNFVLVFHPYVKGNSACAGCAFKFANSSACQAAKTCTPKDNDGNRLVSAGYVWKLVD